MRRDSSLQAMNPIPRQKSLAERMFEFTGLSIFKPKFIQDLNITNTAKGTQWSDCGKNHRLNQPRSGLKLKKENIAPQEHLPRRLVGNPVRPFEVRLCNEEESKQIVEDCKVNLQPLKPLKYARMKGLQNIGNTCYMNSILQNLFHLTAFTNELYESVKRLNDRSCLPISISYLKLFLQMVAQGDDVLAPNSFKLGIAKQKGRFVGHGQQDAQELLTAFLELVNEENNRVKGKAKYRQLEGDSQHKTVRQISQQWWEYYQARDNSIICDFFQSQAVSTVECHNCSGRSLTFDNLWGLPVNLTNKPNSVGKLLSRAWGKGTDTSLEDYRCSKCKKVGQCTKLNEFFRLPEILVVQLKRFQFGKWRKEKIKSQIIIEPQLDMVPFLHEEADPQRSLYRLNGIVNHYGQVNYGHYTAIVRDSQTNRWSEINDSKVNNCSNISLSAESVYLLFYQRLP